MNNWLLSASRCYCVVSPEQEICKLEMKYWSLFVHKKNVDGCEDKVEKCQVWWTVSNVRSFKPGTPFFGISPLAAVYITINNNAILWLFSGCADRAEKHFPFSGELSHLEKTIKPLKFFDLRIGWPPFSYQLIYFPWNWKENYRIFLFFTQSGGYEDRQQQLEKTELVCKKC